MDTKKGQKKEKVIKMQELINFFNSENAKLIRHYGAEAYLSLRNIEKLTVFPANFIKRHKIDSAYRTKIVDWMMEVLHVFKCETETIFLAVSIMDLFLNIRQLLKKQ